MKNNTVADTALKAGLPHTLQVDRSPYVYFMTRLSPDADGFATTRRTGIACLVERKFDS